MILVDTMQVLFVHMYYLVCKNTYYFNSYTILKLNFKFRIIRLRIRIGCDYWCKMAAGN